RTAARAEADEERALKPAAVLVAAFEIHVRRPGQLRPEGQHSLMARPGVEPDVEDVSLALERRAAAVRTFQTDREELFNRPLPPSHRPVRVEYRRRLLDQFRRHDCRAARGAVDGGNRHAPHPLPRDAPVGPAFDHVVDPVVAPGWNPRYFVI